LARSGEKTAARERVVHNLLHNSAGAPLSAPQYRKFLANDEDDFSFLKEVKQSGIPQFVDSLASLAKERQDNAIERLKTQKELFFDRIGNDVTIDSSSVG